MKNILFICHGNICRSPMAEFVMKDLVKKAGLASRFHIESAATSREEIGNPVYPPAQRKLAEHGISCDGHAARQLTNQDYDKYDLLILVLPYLNGAMPAEGYDETVYPPLESVPRRYAILRRNEWMIQRCDVLIAYVTHGWGGAAKTLAYARKRKKTILAYGE